MKLNITCANPDIKDKPIIFMLHGHMNSATSFCADRCLFNIGELTGQSEEDLIQEVVAFAETLTFILTGIKNSRFQNLSGLDQGESEALTRSEDNLSKPFKPLKKK